MFSVQRTCLKYERQWRPAHPARHAGGLLGRLLAGKGRCAAYMTRAVRGRRVGVCEVARQPELHTALRVCHLWRLTKPATN